MLLQVVGPAMTNAADISIAIMATSLYSFVLVECVSTPSIAIVIGTEMWHVASAKEK